MINADSLHQRRYSETLGIESRGVLGLYHTRGDEPVELIRPLKLVISRFTGEEIITDQNYFMETAR